VLSDCTIYSVIAFRTGTLRVHTPAEITGFTLKEVFLGYNWRETDVYVSKLSDLQSNAIIRQGNQSILLPVHRRSGMIPSPWNSTSLLETENTRILIESSQLRCIDELEVDLLSVGFRG
jgi:hypothetical protein